MNQLKIIMKKEFIQMIREYKIVWLPLVFIFLGISQPVVSYYLPTIIESLGGQQGITIDSDLAVQQGSEVLATTIGSQFDQLGIIIIVVSMMGVVQLEKTNGMLAFILTRLNQSSTYISGKVISNYVFIALSVIIGYIASYLYVYFLFSSIPISTLISALFFYLLWVLFMVSFTTMISTIFNSQGVIALISIAVLLLIRVLVGVSPFLDFLNPASTSGYAVQILMTETVHYSMFWQALPTVMLSILALYIANFWISKKKYHS